jgi:predicted DCC family thiol-disulfide oxidoreductase YuxK
VTLLLDSGWTAHQFRLFRVLLGSYLCVHFAHLLPWSVELFSSAGMLPDPSVSPLVALFPNLLAYWGQPGVAIVLCAAGALAGLLLAAGCGARAAAVVCWLVLATFFTRNPLIANPAMPYVGWMLLAFACAPPLPRLHDVAGNAAWRLPPYLFTAAWVVMALSYSYSGYTKLLSPNWVSGDNVLLVLDNPLARDWLLRDVLLALPDGLLMALTWGILALELAFAPLAFSRRLRPWLWGGMLGVQIGFLLLLDFADLTLGMLLFHLLTFDPAWVRCPARDPVQRIYYDGQCGFCHGFIGFVLAEDRAGALRFGPLQTSLHADRVSGEDQSIVVQTGSGALLERAAAVLAVAHQLGGLWSLLARAVGRLPHGLLDRTYGWAGAVRHRILPAPDGLCPVLPGRLAARLIDEPSR